MKNAFSLEPAFIDGSRGSLFTLHYAPAQRQGVSECIVIAPPFAEEMNRCRYMQNLLGQALAKHGYGLLVPDPYGTGDSAGEFAEADWQTWKQDIIGAAEYSNQLGYEKVTLLGIRLGALLASAVATEVKALKRLVFWQPVCSGKVTLNQFLRLKIAASIARDEDAGTTAQLEEEIDKGHSIQVAGYDMSPDLFKGIHGATLGNDINFANIPIAWFSILASAERKVPRSDLKAMESLRSSGATIDHHTVIAPAFWQAHERTLAPELVNPSLNYLLGSSPSE